jgi:hypothetical protein
VLRLSSQKWRILGLDVDDHVGADDDGLAVAFWRSGLLGGGSSAVLNRGQRLSLRRSDTVGHDAIGDCVVEVLLGQEGIARLVLHLDLTLNGAAAVDVGPVVVAHGRDTGRHRAGLERLDSHCIRE